MSGSLVESRADRPVTTEPRQYFAHSLPCRPPADWEPLREHLERVAALAERFAAKIGAGAWGRLLGFWHDLGKYNPHFQEYLFRENGYEAHLEEKESTAGRVDHSTAGARHAIDAFGRDGKGAIGWLLAYAIAGHHTGLPDAVNESAACLKRRLQKSGVSWEGAPADLLALLALKPPALTLDPKPARQAFQLALLCRMLFSCLVDADFLATEAFLDRSRSEHRPVRTAALGQFLDPLNRALATLAEESDRTAVHAHRQEILAACRVAAGQPPGLFALTVPTGGGKTLASLAFALEHARLNPAAGFERVIYAIPFTSIVEQTAATFASVFEPLGDEVVLEHHSNFDQDERRTTLRARLAAENWDASLVVTTNVQLFESLFAARTSKCRKLHRIVGSIVILDEVQTLPVHLLHPCLAVLRELAANYRCSVVLCTATQPAFDQRDGFPIGLRDVRPILPTGQALRLYESMRRTHVVQLGTLTDAALVEQLRTHDQFLCIVNTRKHAARLYDLLLAGQGTGDPSGLFHLSTWMCGAHRSQVIATIRDRLLHGMPCRVVSTSLIEAGVDLDFPVVFRALAGVDAIAQAAGRCNREGRRPLSPVYVFEPEEAGASHYTESTIASTRELLPDFPDLLDPAAVRKYFELHFWRHSDRWDARAVMECLKDPECQTFAYRAAAERFQMIEDYERPVMVPWGEKGEALVRALESVPAERTWAIARKLQRFTVGLTQKCFDKMVGADIRLVRPDEFGDRFPVLGNLALYDRERGLSLEKMGRYDPASLIG